ncbi:hypothetical protein [Pedobacter soli]|uniref:hypothetical protein n=1 Tax=Pedobacter soli TaxID=390242 RepID=UPI00115FD34D|nr:hypothetical protein [Pedobacter soli]
MILVPNPGDPVPNPGDLVQNPGDAVPNPDDPVPNPSDLVQRCLFAPLQNYIISIIIPQPSSKGERSALKRGLTEIRMAIYPIENPVPL